MFISIPKEFFVPVIFGDKYTLNIENMEYDTEVIRDDVTNSIVQSKAPVEMKTVVKDEIVDGHKGKIYAEIDEEYVNDSINKRYKKLENLKTNKKYMDKRKSSEINYADFDDEYVNKIK